MKHQIAANINEATFMQLVTETAQWYDWHTFHPKPAQLAGRYLTAFDGLAGFPDLVLARRPDSKNPGGVIFAELKTVKGKTSAKQRIWLDTLELAGAETYLWRPTDWDFIHRRLRGH